MEENRTEHISKGYKLLGMLYPDYKSLENKRILVVHSFECAYLLAFKNIVTYVTDDVEMARKFEKEVEMNFAFNADDKVYLVKDWSKVDFNDLDGTCTRDFYGREKAEPEISNDDAWLNAFNNGDLL